jgi:hypothetical protein
LGFVALVLATSAIAVAAPPSKSVLVLTVPQTCVTSLPVSLTVENDDAPKKSCSVFERAGKKLVAASFATNPTIEMRVDALDESSDTISCRLSAKVTLGGKPLMSMSGRAKVISAPNQPLGKLARRDCIEAVTEDLAGRMSKWLTTSGNVPTTTTPRSPLSLGPPLIGQVSWRSPFATLAQGAGPVALPGAGASMLAVQPPRSCNTVLPAAVTAENDAPGRDVVCQAFDKGAQVLAKANLDAPTVAFRVASIVMTPSGPRCEVQMTEGGGSTSSITTKHATTRVAPKSTAQIAAQDCVWMVVEDLAVDLVASLIQSAEP